jgi:hypothetical protein
MSEISITKSFKEYLDNVNNQFEVNARSRSVQKRGISTNSPGTMDLRGTPARKKNVFKMRMLAKDKNGNEIIDGIIGGKPTDPVIVQNPNNQIRMSIIKGKIMPSLIRTISLILIIDL